MIGKLLVLAAALIGIVSFFLPIVTVTQPPLPEPIGFSAMQFLEGADALAANVAELMGQAGVADIVPEQVTKHLDRASLYVLIPFAPSALFLIFSLLGLGRFGRGLGIASLIVGGAAGVLWMIMSSGFQDAAATAAAAAASGGATGVVVPTTAIAFTLILVGAIAGGAGGLLATVAPERS